MRAFFLAYREIWTTLSSKSGARKDHAVAKYALEGLPNKVLAAEYRLALPDERVLAEMIGEARRRVEERRQG